MRRAGVRRFFLNRNFNYWLAQSFRRRATLKVDVDPDLLLQDRPLNLHHFVEGWVYVFSVKVLEDYFLDNFLKPVSIARFGYTPLLARRLVALIKSYLLSEVESLFWLYLDLKRPVSYLFFSGDSGNESFHDQNLVSFSALVSKKQPRWFQRELFGWDSYTLSRRWVFSNTVVDRWLNLLSGGVRGVFWFLAGIGVCELIRALYSRWCWCPNFVFLNSRYNRIRFGRYFIFPSSVRRKWYFLRNPGSRRVVLLPSEYMSRFVLGGSKAKLMVLGELCGGDAKVIEGRGAGTKEDSLFMCKLIKWIWLGGSRRRCAIGSKGGWVVKRKREISLVRRYRYLKKNSFVSVASAGSVVGDGRFSNVQSDSLFANGSLGDWDVALGVLKQVLRFEDAVLTLEERERSTVYPFWKKIGGVDRFEGWAEGQRFFFGDDIYSQLIHKTDTSIMDQLLINNSRGAGFKIFK